jgi:hypothetical protein
MNDREEIRLNGGSDSRWQIEGEGESSWGHTGRAMASRRLFAAAACEVRLCSEDCS